MGNKLEVLCRECVAGAGTLTGVLWGPGRGGSEEAAGGQCILTADEARCCTPNWKQGRCHAFPEQIQEMDAFGSSSH